MYPGSIKIQWKYLRIEILFFAVFYYLFPILTDVEYSYNERHHAGLFTQNLSFDVIYGTFNLPPAILFYFIVRRWLFSKQLGLFILFTALYLIGLHYYMTGVYFVIGHTPLFPLKMQTEALRWYKADLIHFSVIYMFREFLCLGALAYFIRSAKQDAQVRELKETQLITELNYLKAQLHPHFFFNTMNNIYSLALSQSDKTAPLVAKLADMMRYILYEANQKKVPLANEIRFISDYIAAEKIRHRSGNEINFDVQGITNDMEIEPLLLLPFIENAFKHGLEQETGAGFVNVVICRAENELILQVNNSKPQSVAESTRGIGLQNALKRLDLLYPQRHQLDIKADDKNYQVTLSLQTT
jgi:two-component system LytT family sensor kinase